MWNSPSVLLKAAKGQGLARLHGYGPEVDLTFAGQHILDHVIIAPRHAGRGDDHVGVEALADFRGKRFDRVLRYAEQFGDAAIPRNKRSDARRIAIVDSSIRAW